MSILSLRLPESLHKQVKLFAKKDAISINQFIASAVAEKMSALLTEDYIKNKALQGNKDLFSNSIKKVPNTSPEDFDELDAK